MKFSRELSLFESLEARRLLHAGHDHGSLDQLHLVAVDDAYVRGAQFASTNFGDAGELEVKTSTRGVYDRDAFLRFDIASLDPASVDSVTLRFFAGSSQPSNTTAVPIAVRLAAAAWSESAINYNNAPSFTGGSLATLSVAGGKQWFEIDVTQAVVNARLSSASAIAFGIEGTANVPPYALINSSESSTNQPELVALVGDSDDEPVDPPPVAGDATLIAIDDAHVRGGSDASSNFGAANQLQIKHSSNSTYQRFAYIRFDVTSLSAKTVPSATLRFWGETSQENATLIPIAVGGAENDWDESTVTFDSRPSLSGGTFGTINLTSNGKWFEINVTAYVQAAANAGQTSITFSLSGVTNSPPFGVINSSEASSNAPELVIGSGGVVNPPPTPAQPITWTGVASNPVRREEAVSFDYDGKLYVIGGYVDSTTYAATQRGDVYDPATNAWSRLADAPTKITHAGTAVDDQTGTVWMVAGFIGDFPAPQGTDVVWKYTPANDTWTRGPDLPEARGAGGAAIVGRTLYYFGGSDATRSSDESEAWSLELDNPDATWQPIASMPTARNHFGYAAVGTRIYVIGGQVGLEDQAINQNVVNVYDTTTDTWSQAAPLPRILGHFHASTDVYMDRYILIAGGEQPHNSAVDDVYLYDTQTNTWTGLTDLPAGRRAPVGRIINDSFFVGTGYNRGIGFSDQMWVADLTALALPS
jgi:N-acetylneuraminic acid mutarotase